MQLDLIFIFKPPFDSGKALNCRLRLAFKRKQPINMQTIC